MDMKIGKLKDSKYSKAIENTDSKELIEEEITSCDKSIYLEEKSNLLRY